MSPLPASVRNAPCLVFRYRFNDVPVHWLVFYSLTNFLKRIHAEHLRRVRLLIPIGSTALLKWSAAGNALHGCYLADCHSTLRLRHRAFGEVYRFYRSASGE